MWVVHAHEEPRRIDFGMRAMHALACPQNITTLRQCSANNTRFQAIERTTSVSSNEFRKQPSIYIVSFFYFSAHKKMD
jgi:DNA-binding transcriptional regulator YdaS (Cro superfamily)